MRLDHRGHLRGWLRLALFLSLSFAVMALAFAAADAHAQTFSKPPMKLSNTSGSSAPQVVVDSNGHIEVVWEDSACGIWFSGSTDSGTTFSAPASVAKANSCSQDERIAVDPQGNINVVWSSPSAIYFARSTDGGSTFSTPTNISQSIPAANYPAMVLAADGSINVEWKGISPRGIFLSRSENGGGSFSTTTIWNLPAQPETVAGDERIATRADGSIDVVWSYSSDTGAPYCDIFFSRSTDKGAHFASPTNLSHSTHCATFPQMSIDANGNIDVMWVQGGAGLFFSQSTDGGANFSSPTSIPQTGSEQMAVDANGSINIAFWHDPHMMFSRSVNGGANFSTPKDLGPAGGGHHIAVDSQGNIVILLQGAYANGHDDIFFTRSTDGGSNFSTPVNVSNNSGQAGLSEMAVEANGNIDIVWYDNGSGDTSVYFRRAAVSGDFTISAAPASLVVLPGGSATAQITVTSTGGFNRAVNLSCTKLPPGASCSFDSASVTPSDSGAHANVTLTVPPTMAQGSFTMTLNGASGSTTQTQDIQVAMGGMTGSVTPTAAVIPAAGGTANFTVSISSSGGFSGQVNLACGGAPSGASCIFNPAQLTVSPNGSVSSTLTVLVATKPAGSLTHRNPRGILPIMQESLPIFCFVLLLCTLALALSRDARTFLREAYCRRAAMARALGAIALTIALAAAMVSCGGATNKSSATVGGSTSVTFPLAIQTRSGSAIVNLGTISVTVP